MVTGAHYSARRTGTNSSPWFGKKQRALQLYDDSMKALPIAGRLLAGDAQWIDSEHIELFAIERLTFGEQQLIAGK